MNRFFKNFILYGDIDFCCILCQEGFETLDLAEKHIRWEQHRKVLRSQVKMTKFKKDSIYKVDDIYYCEDCNRVLTSIAEIKRHIDDAKHKENKASPVIELPKTICQREPGDTGLILIGNLKVTMEEWHGIVDSKCVLCDMVVDIFLAHIATSRHVINLIHSEICTAEGQQYYRKINNEICYCFMCKSTFPTSSVNEHWLDHQHLVKMRATIQSLIEKTKSDRAHYEKKLGVAVQLVYSQREFFDIDVANTVAICKICKCYLNINFLQMIQHRKTHNVTSTDDIVAKARAYMDAAEEKKKKHKKSQKKNQNLIFDHGKRRSELAKFGRENYMKLVHPGGKGYCTLCNRFVSAHMNNFTQHANGLIHIGNLRLKETDVEKVHPEYDTKRLRNFLESVVLAENFYILWINQSFGIDIYSFMFISIIDKKAEQRKMKCYACGIIFDYGKAKEHCLTEQHKEIFINSGVVTTIDGEFIREIQPNLYHCGFCNLTFPYSGPLEKHLYSFKHLFLKLEREKVHTLIKTYYEGIVPPNFNYERVYSYLMNIIF